MESLPFPVCDNRLVCPSPGGVNRALLNLNNEESREYWQRLTVRQQTVFLRQCTHLELPWSAIRSERFEMKRADTENTVGGDLWDGLFIPQHAVLVKQLLEDHQDVYDHEEPPRFDGITIVLGYDLHFWKAHTKLRGRTVSTSVWNGSSNRMKVMLNFDLRAFRRSQRRRGPRTPGNVTRLARGEGLQQASTPTRAPASSARTFHGSVQCARRLLGGRRRNSV